MASRFFSASCRLGWMKSVNTLMSRSTPSFARAGLTNSRISAWGTGVAPTTSFSPAWADRLRTAAARTARECFNMM
ncbi:hypothetical protein D3C85_1601520 [compost metagenome]